MNDYDLITSHTFKSIIIDITLRKLSDFVSYRITEKYILPRLFE